MSTLNMIGPYGFNKETIDKILNDESIGNYALGYNNEEEKFVVCYVGRATEQSLKNRLIQHLGEHPKKFKMFKYSYAPTRLNAYLKECKNYHDFGGSKTLINDYHPSKLKDYDTPCPVCGE